MSDRLSLNVRTQFKGEILEGSMEEGLIVKRSMIAKIAELLASSWNPTKEIHLENLGIFPLPEGQISLLSKQYNYGQPMEVLKAPELCVNSHIPIYSSDNYIYIPPLGFPACRYFGEIWTEPGESTEDLEILLAGFLTLSSFIS